ncbi:MAG: hypothetical protein ACRCYU_10235 [Nocardioides sp.]
MSGAKPSSTSASGTRRLAVPGDLAKGVVEAVGDGPVASKQAPDVAEGWPSSTRCAAACGGER